MNVLLCLPRLDCLPLLRLFPPVGIAYVSASLKKAGFNVYTFNTSLSVKRPLKEELRHIITENNITIVGCGGLVTDYPGIKEIIDTVKSIKPEIITFIGGSFVTYSPTEAMSLISTADIGIIGEGEVTTCELISALEAREDIRMVRGLVIRDDCGKDTITLTEPRTEIIDINSIPWPDREGFGLYDIFPDSPYGAVTTSRSCPHRCTFCAYSGGTAYKERCLDGVFDEIDYLIGKYKIKKLSLSDELFSTRIERLIEFCLRIKPYGLKWRVFLRASGNLTADVTEAMFSAGCEAVYFGLESADDRILKSMKKGITLKDIEHSLALTKAAGIHTTGAFIFGDTNETMETAQNTINWIFDNINLFDWVTLEPIILYPGSQLYDDAVKRGAIKDTTEFIKNGCPLLNISKLTDSEYWHLIEEILPEANKKLQHKALSDYARTGKKRWIPT